VLQLISVSIILFDRDALGEGAASAFSSAKERNPCAPPTAHEKEKEIKITENTES
tara:strand:+ start:624 stop:788 length:165 start_codon:yes stop_codon:yes gene_type:complete